MHFLHSVIKVPARAGNGSQVTCLTPRFASGVVQLSVSNNNGTSFSANSVSFTFRAACPPTSCPAGQGVCSFGTCVCVLPFSGTNCATRLIAPSINATVNKTLNEGDEYVELLTATGDGPMSWSLVAPVPRGMVMDQGEIRWTARVAPGDWQAINVVAENLVGRSFRTYYVRVTPSFSATVTSVSQPVFVSPATQVILGRAVGTRVAGVPVAVLLRTTSVLASVPSLSITLSATTNATGFFSVPLYVTEAGSYQLAASHPDLVTPVWTAQLVFDALGMRSVLVNPSFRLSPGLYPGLVVARLSNPLAIPLTGLRAAFVVVGGAVMPASIANLTASFSQRDLAPQSEVTFSVSFNASANVAASVRLGVTLTATTNGTTVFAPPVLFELRIVPPAVVLRVLLGSLRGQVVRGQQSILQVAISNEGDAEAGSVQLTLPTPPSRRAAADTAIAFSRVSPLPATLAAQSNFTLLIAVTAGTAAPLTQFRGSALLTAGATSLSLGMDVSVLGSVFVDVLVVVRDEFSFFHPDKPNVANAIVDLDGPAGKLSGRTNATGFLLFAGVREGFYNMRTQALQRSPAASVVQVSSTSNFFDIFLYRSAVSYTWTVTPTLVQDRYTFTLEATFETFVPMPVVTVQPAWIDMDQLELGLIPQILFNITNHGLITAGNLDMSLPDGHPVVGFDILSPTFPLSGGLPGGTSVMVPTRVRNKPVPPSHATYCVTGRVWYEVICNGVRVSNVAITFSTSGPCGGAGGRGRAGAAGAAGGYFVPMAVASSNECVNPCDLYERIKDCIFDGCVTSLLDFACMSKEDGLEVAKKLAGIVLDCAVGGCAGAIGNAALCDVGDPYAVAQCILNMGLSCSGPYGEAIGTALSYAKCAVAVGGIASGPRRRRGQYGNPQAQLRGRVFYGMRARRDALKDAAAQGMVETSQMVINYLLLQRAVFGSLAAEQVASPALASALLPVLADQSPLGPQITTAELNQTLAFAPASTINTTAALLARWNNTMALWAAGLLTRDAVAARFGPAAANESVFFEYSEIQQRMAQVSADTLVGAFSPFFFLFLVAPRGPLTFLPFSFPILFVFLRSL